MAGGDDLNLQRRHGRRCSTAASQRR
jgi:hypothetical protein